MIFPLLRETEGNKSLSILVGEWIFSRWDILCFIMPHDKRLEFKFIWKMWCSSIKVVKCDNSFQFDYWASPDRFCQSRRGLSKQKWKNLAGFSGKTVPSTGFGFSFRIWYRWQMSLALQFICVRKTFATKDFAFGRW